ncbi:hypothetical protein SISSUDRAFT_1044356 [Sistotremastrum suecicum HHB10207 ss-3]|uniref:Uncharacterized protein n=1 Tax=Sistotremastrum suecicum HHB10207 ss-3 TaxID=1314776 RepID=A0A166F9V3_9AGAM|nr:hypothetical protein SISSUDRAFT_1044356 [Sistotremastrum suecicum HHB10207 ss-3]
MVNHRAGGVRQSYHRPRAKLLDKVTQTTLYYLQLWTLVLLCQSNMLRSSGDSYHSYPVSCMMTHHHQAQTR